MKTHGCARGRRQYGATLIEQIFAVAVMATLVGVAAPSLGSMVDRSRLQVAQTDLISALQYARGTAAMRGARTVFCPSADGRRCSDDGRWGAGWLVAIDRNHDNQPDGAPLRVGGGYAQLIIQGSAGRRRVAFQNDGSAGGSNLTLLLCGHNRSQKPLSVVVSNAGRIRGAPATAAQAAACAAARG